MTGGADNSKLSESVEELKLKLEAMKRIMEYKELTEEKLRSGKSAASKATIIDGNFLSVVFVIVLLLVVTVSVYAFFNLFVALKKKYPGQHSEL